MRTRSASASSDGVGTPGPVGERNARSLLCVHCLLRRSRFVCGHRRARKPSARSCTQVPSHRRRRCSNRKRKTVVALTRAGERVKGMGRYGEDLCAPEPRQFWGWDRPSTIPAKCSAPATPTAGANNNELIKMRITSTNTREMCWCFRLVEPTQGSDSLRWRSNPNQPEHPRWSRLCKPIIPKSSKLFHAIAMYEASARPRRHFRLPQR